MYKLIAVISVFVRQFILPNPFEQLPNAFLVSVSGIPVAIPPIALNILVEPLLHAMSFAVVRLYYTNGVDNPSKGSFLYLVFYCVHITVLSTMAKYQFATLAVSLIIVGYIGCHIGIVVLINKISNRT